MLLEKIEELLKEVDSLTAKNAEEVAQLRIKYLSKKGEINALMADFRNVPAEQKKEVGINPAIARSFSSKLWIMSGINGPRIFVMNEIVNQNIMINVSILHFLLLFMIYRSF